MTSINWCFFHLLLNVFFFYNVNFKYVPYVVFIYIISPNAYTYQISKHNLIDPAHMSSIFEIVFSAHFLQHFWRFVSIFATHFLYFSGGDTFLNNPITLTDFWQLFYSSHEFLKGV